jgi:2-iminobutanoate/2-iminopropanoate deaminase
MKREVVRVEPISSWLERWKAPASPVTRAGNMIFVSGLPPFDPATGEFAAGASIERQSELVMAQLKQCLEAVGATLDNVMKCNVFCTSSKHFAAVNAVYRRYFPENPPARIFVCIPEWTGPFDIEIDCIAMM